MTRNNFAVSTGLGISSYNVNDETDFGVSIYCKVHEGLNSSVNLTWTSGTKCTCFGIVAK